MILDKYLRNILGSAYIKHTSTLFSGNAIGQIIRIALYPIIARLYLPNNFGTFSLFLTISGILTTFANAEYYNAIVLPKKDEDAIALVHLNIIINTCILIICSSLLYFKDTFASLLGEDPIISKYLIFIPLLVWLSAFWKAIQFWFIRKKNFTPVSLFTVTNIGINAGSKTLFGLLSFQSWGLVWSSILAPILTLILITLKYPYKIIHFLKIPWNKQDIKDVAKRYSNFPKFALPTSFINTLSVSLPTLIFAPAFGLYQVGLFAMAISLTLTPINTFCGSLYQVTYQKFSELFNDRKSILPYYIGFIKHFLLIAIPGFILIYFITPWLVNAILGNGWEDTSLYIQLMLPWLFCIGIVKVMSFIPDIFDLQKYEMYIELLYLVIRMSTIYIGIKLNSMSLSILLFSLGNMFVMIGQIIWYYILLKRHDKRLINL